MPRSLANTSMRRIASLMAVLCCTSIAVRAADLTHVLVGYSITSWSTRNGGPARNGWMPSSNVWALAQDADGYVWLGTESGLVRFDGERFSPWGASGSVRLPTGPVRSLCVAQDGSLWIGTSTSVSRIRKGQLTNFAAGDGLVAGMTTAIVEDQSGAIWAAQSSGLFRFASERWELSAPASGLPRGPVGSAFVDRGGTLFVGTTEGTFRLRKGERTFIRLESSDSSVNGIVEDNSGVIWTTDPIAGARQVTKPLALPHGLEGGFGNRLLVDHKGNLWVGTAGQGLWRVHRDADGAFRTERATTMTGLLTDGVISLLEDRDGNIWAGTTEGLNRLTPYKLTPVNLGLTDGAEVTPDGSIWIASVNGLIEFPDARIDLQRPPARLPRTRASAMHADRNGTLWVAQNGLLQIVGGRPVSVRVDGRQLPRRIASITSNARGDLMLYDLDQGLLRLTKGRIEAVPLPQRLQRTAIVATYGDTQGRVWAAFADGQMAVVDTEGALRVFGKGDGLDAGIYQVIYEDDDGVLWAGGSNGVSRCANGTCATVLGGKEFPAELVTAIVQDEEHALWLGTRFGIVRVEPVELEKATADRSYQPQYTLFDRSDGLGGMPVTTGLNRRVVRAHDGQLWFVTRRGVTLIDPLGVRPTPGPAPVHIESVVADGQPLTLAEGVRLPSRTTRLVIDYGLLNLTSQVKTRFRYRLEGFDAMWTDAGADRQAVYTNLPPGSYRFRVMANSDGNRWTESAVAWDFSISPMFYQTAWFFVVCAVAAGLSVWTAWRFHLRQVRREFSLLLKERARLSRELHDTLLQSLVGVALQCEAMAREPGVLAPSGKDRFIRMRKRIEEHIREARQSIWDLRSPALESRDLAAALRHAAKHASEGQSVAVQFSVDGAPRPCAPKVQEQLLRIGQEALVNAVRHGRADQVSMQLQYAVASVALRVCDNGCGFDPERVARHPNGHCGLISMKERAADIGGTLTIDSSVSRGTTIETIVPLSSHT